MHIIFYFVRLTRSCQCILFFSSGLLDLANAYCEPILKKQCEQIIRHGITVQNVAMLYAASIKFEAKVTVICVFSFRDLLYIKEFKEDNCIQNFHLCRCFVKFPK